MFGFYAEDGDKVEFTQTDFAQYIEANKPRLNPKKEVSVIEEVNKMYNRVLEEKAFKFKEDRLPKTNLEYKLLLQEYRDGILLFDLTDKKVWSKAIKDTTGLQEFYEGNKSNYMWNERADVTIYKCADVTIATQLEKVLKKKAKKGYTNDDIIKMINTDSQLALSIEDGKFEKAQNEAVDKATWTKGSQSKTTSDKNVTIVVVNDIIQPEPKQLNEVRGLVTSDYQNFLEQKWVKELKAKYKVTVNKEVLKLVK